MRMDKHVGQCDMEVMKMAMLKHEETFRHQVHELHRLYRIQRQLMSDLSRAELSSRWQQQRRSKQLRRALNLQLPADEYIVSADEDDGTELELTLAVGGRRCSARVRKNGSKQEGNNNSGSSPFASDCSGTSLSSTEYSEGPLLHAPPPCQRAMEFDLGVGEVTRQSPWLVQCQYLSLSSG